MSDDLFLRYGRAVYEAARWKCERDGLAIEIESLATNPASVSVIHAPSISANPNTPWPSLVSLSPLSGLRRGGRYHGALKRVARQIGVGLAHIYHVSCGLRPSDKILKAIRAEFSRIDALWPKDGIIPLNDAERAQFGAGGKYRGIASRLSNITKVSRDRYRKAIRNPELLPTEFMAVRAEMARIDGLKDESRLETPRLTTEERSRFRNGERYFGLLAHVARKLGLSEAHVRMVASGGRHSERTLAAIRAEMIRKDAGVAL